MHIPSYFALTDDSDRHEVIRRYPLATLITPTAGGLIADHIPMLLKPCGDGKYLLQGHVARGNTVWKSWLEGGVVLAIFQGPEHYISPSWYASKAVDGRVVPTWNYVTVHVRGKVRAIEERDWILAFLERLTDSQEENLPYPWKVSDSAPDYLDQLVRVIVGVEMEVTHIEGKAKLNQNHPQENRASVKAGLESQATTPALDMLDWMKGF